MKKIVAVALLAIAMNSQAQKVSSRLNFEKGKKLELVADSKSTISQEMMGQTMEMNITSTITRSFDVEDVSKEGATIEHKVKRVQFNFEGMGQTQSFDSENEEDRKGEMGKNFEKSLKNKYTMVIGPNGKIVSVKADDDNPNVAANNDAPADPMSSLMNQFAEGLEMPDAGEASTFQVLPEGGVTKGQTWTDSLKNAGTGFTKYTVTDITPTDILVDYTSESAIEQTQESMGMEAIISMKTKANGRITVDRKTGLLKQKTINAEGLGSVDVAGQSIPMSSKQIGTITVKGL